MGNYEILRAYCEKIYLTGVGNFWHEDGVIGDDNRVLYKIYTYSLLFIYCFMTVLEVSAIMFGNFPEDEISDALALSVSHVVVMIKMFSVISNKKLIKMMNRKMIAVCEWYEEEKVVSATYRSVKRNMIAYCVMVYGALSCFVFQGLMKMYSGSHFVTVITYYPSYGDYSTLATVCRVFNTVILLMLLITMIVSVDGFTMGYLIMLKYKFITLRHFFEKLREDFDKINASRNSRSAVEMLTNGLVEGIVMHNEILKLGNNVDKAFGTVIALQLFQSSGSAVSLMLQIALIDQLTLIAGLKFVFFVVGLFLMLGLFLCNAGEITYQASLLSDAIFYCGWHACPPLPAPQPNHQKIVLQACAQAQRPLVMKAFKMVDLSYATFLTVLRGTYSVFALFYAQKK